MTFGVNMNHLSSGLELGFIYPNNLSINPKAARPLVYNVIDASTIVNLINIMSAPSPQIFIGTMKFSTTPVDDSRSLQLSDPVNNYSFYYTDSFAINGRGEKFITIPIFFTKITSTLSAKYSLCLFGYLFEYKLNP